MRSSRVGMTYLLLCFVIVFLGARSRIAAAKDGDEQAQTVAGTPATKPAENKDGVVVLIIAKKGSVDIARVEKVVQILIEPDVETKKPQELTDALVEVETLKLVELAPLVLNHLEFAVKPALRRRIPTLEEVYPASRALAAIGKPAISPLIESMESPNRTERFQRIARSTLMAIYGSREEAKKVLDGEAASLMTRTKVIQDTVQYFQPLK